MTHISPAPKQWNDEAITPEEVNALLEAARVVATRAYAPYSKFRVGAALLTPDKNIILGCNVENASYGLTCCAERTAMFSAIAQGYTTLTALAVTCPDGHQERPHTLMPCGACRQVMSELLVPDAPIFIDGVGQFSTKELLPHAFSL